MVKKYLNLILLGCAVLFSVLVFATMSGTGLSATLNAGVLGSYTGKVSVYELMKGDNPYGLAVTCLVLVILVVVAVLAVSVLELLVKKYNKFNHFIALGVALVSFVTAILFFCFATGDYSNYDLGAGCVFSGLFMLIVAGTTGTFGALKLLKK